MSGRVTGHILVVDDQPNWRAVLTEALTEEGYAVTMASDFEEALEALSENTFDLAVLDVRLVDHNSFNVEGVELLRHIKAQEMPPSVIILTGYPESLREETLERCGADALLLKVPPGSHFNAKDFKKQVRELLS